MSSEWWLVIQIDPKAKTMSSGPASTPSRMTVAATPSIDVARGTRSGSVGSGVRVGAAEGTAMDGVVEAAGAGLELAAQPATSHTAAAMLRRPFLVVNALGIITAASLPRARGGQHPHKYRNPDRTSRLSD